MLVRMLRALQGHMTTLSLSELTQGLNACLKVLTRIQTPVVCSGMSKESQPLGEKESLAQVRRLIHMQTQTHKHTQELIQGLTHKCTHARTHTNTHIGTYALLVSCFGLSVC